jgi:ankyrin repeat protein
MNPQSTPSGWTELHSAARDGRLDEVRRLLEQGADPNAREAGDNTYPLHWAAAARHVEVARALLDAGGDVHGVGDVHEMDVIGWATFFHAHDEPPDDLSARARELVALLVEGGARHHIFSAMCVGDLDLIRQVVGADPNALARRMSKFEGGLTPIHFAIGRKRYDILDLLVTLGADLEARNLHDQTALETALLRGDREAAQRLRAAGAMLPAAGDPAALRGEVAGLAGSTRKIVPMIMVPDVAAALAWYVSIGFAQLASFGEDGVLNFAMVSFGNAEVMLNMHGKTGRHDVSLWFYTNRIDDLYQLLKARQFAAARAALDGGPYEAAVEFVEDLYEPFYGGREFGIRDLNGYELYFMQDS